MRENEQASTVFTQFQDDLEAFFTAFDRLHKLSGWMTNVALASLAFFVTLLFQVRSKAAVPDRYLAAGILVAIVISILLGFYAKLRLELGEFATDLERGGRAVSGFIRKASSVLALPGDRQELYAEAGEGFREWINEGTRLIPKHVPWWVFLAQGATLGLGLVLFGVYVGRYLFRA